LRAVFDAILDSPAPAPAPTAFHYDRDAALRYARKYWNRVCDDGYIAIDATSPNLPFKKVPLDTNFVFDGDGTEHAASPDGRVLATWNEIDDCTHFISCCIGNPKKERGGGKLTSDFLDIYGILGAERMKLFLIKNNIATLVKEFNRQEYENETQKERLLVGLQPGDIIAYRFRGDSIYHHLALYLGDGKIACHTYCRCEVVDLPDPWSNAWDSVNGEQFALLHFN
jgi:hypothetical protein